MKKAEKGLTEMEQTVMRILWETGRDMTNMEIAGYLEEDKVSAASVAQVMKRLLAKGVVAVREHILVSNVYARTFYPCITREQFVMEELVRLRESAFLDKRKGVLGLVAGLLDTEDGKALKEEELDELDAFLERKRRELKKER